MTSIYPAKNVLSFDQIKAKLLAYPTPLARPTSVNDPSLTDAISTLYLHPALESLLHILNQDLESAHFLVRHMQAAPEIEGMYLHGILHRIEGDIDNARAWYADVCDKNVFKKVWGEASEEEGKQAEQDTDDVRTGKLPAQKKARDFLDGVEEVQKGDESPKANIEKEAKREIETVLDWCVERFGIEKKMDVSKNWVQPGQDSDTAQQKQAMLTGGEGHRKF